MLPPFLRARFVGPLLALLAGAAGGYAPAALAEGRRPNILIAVADDWSFPHAGAYGIGWVRTPHFDRVAAEGVLFSNAYTPVAKCSAARAALLTGRNPWQLEAGFTHWSFFPPEHRTFAEALAAAGYASGFTGKGWAPGTARAADGTERALLGPAFQRRRLDAPPPSISAIDYAANLGDFLEAVPAGRPWCFWYGGNEPHRGYAFRSGAERGGKALADIRNLPAWLPDTEEVRHDLLDYALEIEHFDDHLGRMLAELERRGLLENTLVIVTADNGMPFPRAKGQCYEAGVHLPLAIRWPRGIPHPGRVVDDYVSLPELAPTVLDAAGLDWDGAGMSPIPGRSLVPLLASAREGRVEAARDAVLVGRERHDPGRPRNEGYPIRGIIADGLMYLRNYEPDRWPSGNPETGYLDVDSGPSKTALLRGRRTPAGGAYWQASFGLRPDEELYDLHADPDCLDNLVGHLNRAADRFTLRDRMESAFRRERDPRVARGADAHFDAFRFAREDFNDFYERFHAGQVKLPAGILPSDVEPSLQRN